MWGVLLLVCGCDRAFGLTEQFDARPGDVALPTDVPSSREPFAHYAMDALGQVACLHDDSGHDHDGNCVAPVPTIAGGKYAGAFQLGGTTRMSVSSAPALEGPSFTIGAWVNYQSGKLSPDGMCILNKPYQLGDANSWQICVTPTATALFFQTTETIPNQTVTYAQLPPGGWHHLAMVYEAGDPGTVHTYIDAVHQGDVKYTLVFDDQNLAIGADLDAMQTDYGVNGLLDDLWIFPFALTDAEVATMASGAAP